MATDSRRNERRKPFLPPCDYIAGAEKTQKPGQVLGLEKVVCVCSQSEIVEYDVGESKKSCYGNFADFPCCLVYPAVYAFNAMLCHALLSISSVSDYFCSLDSILCLKIRWVDGEDRHLCIVGLEKLSHSGKKGTSQGDKDQRMRADYRAPLPTTVCHKPPVRLLVLNSRP